MHFSATNMSAVSIIATSGARGYTARDVYSPVQSMTCLN